jgi:hypothetical protein
MQAQPKMASQFLPACMLKVVTRRTLSVSGKSVTMYRISMEGQHIVALIDTGIADAPITSRSTEVRDSDATTVANVWIPLPLVQYALPKLVKKGDEGPAPVVGDFHIRSMVSV